MKRITFRLLPILLLAFGLLLLPGHTGAAKRPLEFADARLIIEFNSTDEDVGVQVFLDGEPWKNLSIIDPNGNTILQVAGQSQLDFLGLTELFFESTEPSLADLPLEEFLALFPEGEYEFVAQTVDGQAIEGTATFTHNIPPGAVIVSPAEGAVVNPANAVIDWQPVSAAGMEIVAYQVIVESGPLNVLDVKVPATVTRLTIPSEVLLPRTDYAFEVLAIESGGNQTITSGTFKTAR